VPDQPLDVPEEHLLLVVAERQRDARGPRPRRASDAVHVRLRHVRQVEVDDVRHPVDVDPPRRDIGGHQHAQVTTLKIVERPRARPLRLVAVDRRGPHAALLEELDDPVGPVLGPTEHQRAGDRPALQQRQQQLRLVRLGDEVQALLDLLDRLVDHRDADLDRVAQQRRRQRADLRGHRRREQQVLAAHRQRRDDALHVRQEPHVEHVVRLVEHEHLDLAQVDEPAAHQVQQPPRRGDQDVDPAPELADLRALGHAAEDHRVPQVLEVLAVGREALADLGRQLAGRRQHQRADLRVVASRRVEPLQHRQRERRRLAGARLGAADDVTTGQSRPDRLALDRRRLDVTSLGDGPQEFREKI
jgi:hypothetical protein